MKGGKQSKNKTIWDQVKNEEKDFYFNFLTKKYRNLQKKLKDIADLEELQKTKELKPEQVQKIQNKDENNERIKELEVQVSNWLQAKKEAEQNGSIITQEAFILILEHLSENQDTLELLFQNHSSLYDLAKQLQNRIINQQKKQDQSWKGLKLKHQSQTEVHHHHHHHHEETTQQIQQQQQETTQQPDTIETHKEHPIQQEQYVLMKSSPKKSFQDENRQQVHQPIDQLTNQHTEQQEQQEKQNHPSQQEVQQQSQTTEVKEEHQHDQKGNHQHQKDEHRHHHHDDQRKGYKKNYHNDRRNNNNGDNNKPYRGNRYHNRDRPQREEWQEKKEIHEHDQNNDNKEQNSSDEEYITIERRAKKPQQKPSRGSNRNHYDNKNRSQRNPGDNQETVDVQQ